MNWLFVSCFSNSTTMRTTFYLAVYILFFTLSSCSKNKNGACGKGKADFAIGMPVALTFENYDGSNTLQNGKIFYTYSGSRVQFFIAGTMTNVCTDEHLKVNFSYYLTGQPQPVPLKIQGEALWHVLLGYESIIMATGTAVPGQSVTNSYLECGLKQVFQSQPATVDVFNTVEFDTQGSFSADSAYFLNHVELLEIYSTFSKAS